MSPRVVRGDEVRAQRTDDGQPAGPIHDHAASRVARRHTPKGALKWRWGTVAAVALSKMDDGQLAYEYLIAGGDGSMYLRWDHQLLRPSDGEVDPFREGRTMAVGSARVATSPDPPVDRASAPAADE